ncbi:MAG: DUF6531 domain-containing protein [Minicystis sp.]
MARTAPAPNIPPIPGMCPSVAVLAGGGDGGSGSGNGAGDGEGDENAGAGQGGENAEADERGAPDYEKYPECGYASHPVDVITGRAFTHPIVELELPGPLPLRFARMYSSKMADRDAGLGFGWGHTFGWEIQVERRRIVVWNEQGVGVDFPVIRPGEEILGPWGWVLRREAWGFAVDADDGLWHIFSAATDEGKRFRLTAIEDRNKNRIALTYDDGRLVEVKDSAGRIVRLGATREGRVASIQVQNALAQGQWIAFATYTYDEHGNLAAATDADGHTARYTYDGDHRLTSDTDRAGLCFHFVYDREGRCVESWGDYPGKRDPSLAADTPRYLHDGKTRAKGIHHCKFEYGSDGTSEVVDSTQVRRFFGTKRGTLTKKVEGGGVLTAAYRDDGHLLARTNAVGATTHFERDARGRVTSVIDPLGRTTTIERDAAGLPVQIVDPAGGVTQAARDARGNVLAETDALGHVTSYRYDERGLCTEIVDGRGARTSCTYDAHGNRTTLVEPDGATFRYTHDALGRLLAVADPQGGTTRYAYSARGDLVAVYDAAGGTTRYAYDGERHVVEIADGEGHATRLTWGGYHKLCARRDPNAREVRLAYNTEGELLAIHNERGEVHSFTRDPSGRLVGERTFDGRALHYKNDALGRPVLVTDHLGHKTRFTYDAAGQLVGRELWDGAAEEMEYDARGAMIACRWADGEVRFERDALGRIVREAQRVGEEEHVVEIAYDAEGDRVGRRTSLGHDEIVARDATGARRRTVLDGHAIDHAHGPSGLEIARELAAGGRIESAYDPVGRLAKRRALGPTARRSLAAGEPALLGPEVDGATVALSYGYDRTGDSGDGLGRAARRDDARVRSGRPAPRTSSREGPRRGVPLRRSGRRAPGGIRGAGSRLRAGRAAAPRRAHAVHVGRRRAARGPGAARSGDGPRRALVLPVERRGPPGLGHRARRDGRRVHLRSLRPPRGEAHRAAAAPRRSAGHGVTHPLRVGRRRAGARAAARGRGERRSRGRGAHVRLRGRWLRAPRPPRRLERRRVVPLRQRSRRRARVPRRRRGPRGLRAGARRLGPDGDRRRRADGHAHPLPRPVRGRGDRARVQPLPLLRPGDRPLHQPRSGRPGGRPEPLRHRRQPGPLRGSARPLGPEGRHRLADGPERDGGDGEVEEGGGRSAQGSLPRLPEGPRHGLAGSQGRAQEAEAGPVQEGRRLPQGLRHGCRHGPGLRPRGSEQPARRPPAHQHQADRRRQGRDPHREVRPP